MHRDPSPQVPAPSPANRRVVVAMSGGVDSSLAAALLVEQGWDVIGVSMRLWEAEEGGDGSGCCTLDDFLDARLVAEQLGIPFYVMDFRAAFGRAVVDDFVAEYRRGRTPNPCARCNQFVKFAALWDRARELGAGWIATGHYARIEHRPHGPELRRGVDDDKDQSYFLFAIDAPVLSRTLFPVGGLRKGDVRAEARRRGLPVADKRDSQEVCFAPRSSYAAFVERRQSAEPIRAGVLADADGHVLGRHDGIHRFTIGQRRGLGGGADRARFVTGIDAATGTVRVGGAADVESSGLVAERVNWLGEIPAVGTTLALKIRSRFPATTVRLIAADASSFAIVSDAGLRAVTPGQAAVLYDGDRVVGGGWIARTLDARPLPDPPPLPGEGIAKAEL